MIKTLKLGTLTAIACAFTMRIAAAQNPLTPDQTTSSDPDKMTLDYGHGLSSTQHDNERQHEDWHEIHSDERQGRHTESH